MAVLRNQSVQAALVLFAILNVAFFPFLWGDKTLLASAREVPSVLPGGAFGEGDEPRPALVRSPDLGSPGWCFEPSIKFQHDLLRREHRLPTWNPYAGYGAPWAANMLSQPFYPPTILLSLFDLTDAVDWFYVLRLWLAGFFAYLFLRFFAGWLAAMVGAIACMLSGYFIIYLNIEHLSAETLVPLVFYAMEGLLREGSTRSRLVGAVTVFASITAGFPESTFVILLHGYAYFLVRLAADPELRGRFRSHLWNFVVVNAVGFGLAAVLLIPFLEFVRLGTDAHVGRTAGTMFFADSRFSLLWFLPTAGGVPPHTILDKPADSFTMFLGYFGVAPAVLAVLAVVSIFRRSGEPRSRPCGQLVVFFLVSILLFVLKIFGHPAVNWIGALPVFHLVYYHKYLLPLLGFSVAMLSGLGAARLFAGKVRPRHLLLATSAILGLIAWLALRLRPELTDAGDLHSLFYRNLAYGAVVLLALTIAASGCRGAAAVDRGPGRRRRVAATAVTAVVLLELLTNYLYPVYYGLSEMPSRRLDPYAGAPYVELLQERAGTYDRVFARQGVLHPNWSAAFGLYDARYLQAIMYSRLSAFVRNFFDTPGRSARFFFFTGRDRPYAFDTWTQRRFLQLSSIRYVVGRTPLLGEVPDLEGLILQQNRERIESERTPAGRRRMGATRYLIGGEAREVLEHVPGLPRVRLATEVPVEAPLLSVHPAFDPRFYRNKGDGVTFLIEIEDDGGRTTKLYERYLDPKRNRADRVWREELVDLSRFGGHSVDLLFTVGAGPAGDLAGDRAGWGELRWHGDESVPAKGSPFRLIYDREVMIYEYSEALPRAAVYYSVAPVARPEEALQRLLDPQLDVRRRAVVSTEGLDVSRRQALAALAEERDRPAVPAVIRHYDSRRVVVGAELERPGLVTLSDTHYPGWKVYVDGRPEPMLEVNYLFRGAVVPRGSHEVEFRYQPWSYRAGGAISGLALLVVGWWAAGSRLARLRLRRWYDPRAANLEGSNQEPACEVSSRSD
jgi:Bacterial membrane protein YfhO